MSKVLSASKDSKLTASPNTVFDKSNLLYNAVIGEGGFGTVYSALFVKWIAVKEVRKVDIAKHRNGIQMLLNELSALKLLKHSFIVPLHLAFQDAISCYMIFDLKLGGDLRYFIKNKIYFEEKDAAFFVSCLSSALQYMHELGVLHRDIKPENILIDQYGYPYLADFGVSHINSTADAGITCGLGSGTRQYLAPEVFTRKRLHGTESDYWSLGVVIYEMIYGFRPFGDHSCPLRFIVFLEEAYQKHRDLIASADTNSKASFLGTASSLNSEVDSNRNFGSWQIDTGDDLSPPRAYPISPLSKYACEEGELPIDLIVPIKPFSSSIGQLSVECQLLLGGLLDIRPSERLGGPQAKNKVTDSLLLKKWGVDNVSAILSKTVLPFFIPGRKQLKCDPASNQDNAYLNAVGKEILPSDFYLSEPDVAKFSDFNYVSDEFQSIMQKNQKE